MKRAERLRQLGIGAQLKEIRREAGLTTRNVATALGISRASVNRNETGRRVPEREELAALCALYGVVGAEKKALLEHATDAAQTPGWLESGQISNELATLNVLERNAVAITKVATALMPGLAQTPEYARLVLSTRDKERAADIERFAGARVLRQTILSRPDAPDTTFLIEEGVLHRTLGAPNVLRDQLDHLLILGRRPNVHVRVLPFDSPVHPTCTGYSLYRVQDGTTCAFVEADRIGMFLADDPGLSSFMTTAEKIARHSLGEDASTEVIKAAALRTEAAVRSDN